MLGENGCRRLRDEYRTRVRDAEPDYETAGGAVVSVPRGCHAGATRVQRMTAIVGIRARLRCNRSPLRETTSGILCVLSRRRPCSHNRHAKQRNGPDRQRDRQPEQEIVHRSSMPSTDGIDSNHVKMIRGVNAASGNVDA